ncbi:hypothetical protein [Mycolicibacterium smegmatis]|uniref:hypothetical protein n=1 Tax=Mycolicibacterium smegmatis TaxID=1772 RepID=UPI001EFC1682|nr:hypothetical protein [Mycolicibacterium smegmatis]ULN72272.1 hypothetical protein KZ782_10435 [Mycolicibacterium smegmatis]
MIAEMLRATAGFIEAISQAKEEARRAFSDPEAGDFLDAGGLADAGIPDPDLLDSDEPHHPQELAPAGRNQRGLDTGKHH